jgi:hypothetical protein
LGCKKGPSGKTGCSGKDRISGCKYKNAINDSCTEESSEPQNARGLEKAEGSCDENQDQIKSDQGPGEAFRG